MKIAMLLPNLCVYQFLLYSVQNVYSCHISKRGKPEDKKWQNKVQFHKIKGKKGAQKGATCKKKKNHKQYFNLTN